MDNFALISEPFLDGYAADFGGTNLGEVTDISLISVAQPLDGQEKLQKAAMSVWGIALPSPGQSNLSETGNVRLLCLGADTFLAILIAPETVVDTAKRLGSTGYTTDQSDNWVTLRLSGPLSYAALERICPIDLNPKTFLVGSFARTSMEHLGTIILKESADTFLLLSASSSALSFLHAVETSIKYTI